MSYEYLYKIVIFGDSYTGKTNFMNKYVSNAKYQVHIPTIGVDFNTTQITSPDGKNIKVHFWDTAGLPKFRNITRAYYGSIAAAVLLFDTSTLSSFESLPRWLADFNMSNTHVTIPTLILGTIYKKQRVVSYETAKRFADKNKVLYDEIDFNENYSINTPPNDILEPLWEKIWQKFIVEDNICLGVKKRSDLLLYNKSSNPPSSKNTHISS